jgi:hypothetical protein
MLQVFDMKSVTSKQTALAFPHCYCLLLPTPRCPSFPRVDIAKKPKRVLKASLVESEAVEESDKEESESSLCEPKPVVNYCDKYSK